MSSAFEKLGLPDTASAAEVEAAWRRLRSEHHPDKGGDAQLFHQLGKAYEEAILIASMPKPCTYCNGTGSMEIRRGFGKTSLMCSVCCGTGVQE